MQGTEHQAAPFCSPPSLAPSPAPSPCPAHASGAEQDVFVFLRVPVFVFLYHLELAGSCCVCSLRPVFTRIFGLCLLRCWRAWARGSHRTTSIRGSLSFATSAAFFPFFSLSLPSPLPRLSSLFSYLLFHFLPRGGNFAQMSYAFITGAAVLQGPSVGLLVRCRICQVNCLDGK